jgi:hypothetical protein
MSAIPYPVQLLVGLLAYSGIVRTLRGQRTGRLTEEEVHILQEEVKYGKTRMQSWPCQEARPLTVIFVFGAWRGPTN